MALTLKEQFQKSYKLSDYWYWLSIWKIRCSYYPIINQSSKYVHTKVIPLVNGSSKRRYEPTLSHESQQKNPLGKKKRRIFTAQKQSQLSPAVHPHDILPMEIWFRIVDYGVGFELVKLNKSFLEQFAPIIYKEINGIMVFSDLEMLKKNDDFFLKYGPERKAKVGVKGYDIYKRRMQAKEFAFEMLDVDQLEWEFLFLSKKHHKPFTKLNPNYITKTTTFLKISQNILQNEKSIMRRFMQNTCLNLDFLFLGETASNILMNERDSLVDRLKANRTGLNAFKTYQCLPGDILHSEHHDLAFDTERIERRKRGEFARFLSTTFPKYGYYNELILVNRVLDLIKSNERQRVRQVKSSEELHSLQPLLNEKEKIGFQDAEVFENSLVEQIMYSVYSALEPSSVHVPGRKFCHKEDIDNLIESFRQIGSEGVSLASLMFCSTHEIKPKQLPAFENRERKVMTPNVIILNRNTLNRKFQLCSISGENKLST